MIIYFTILHSIFANFTTYSFCWVDSFNDLYEKIAAKLTFINLHWLEYTYFFIYYLKTIFGISCVFYEPNWTVRLDKRVLAVYDVAFAVLFVILLVAAVGIFNAVRIVVIWFSLIYKNVILHITFIKGASKIQIH